LERKINWREEEKNSVLENKINGQCANTALTANKD
jgi:hypothetical protein